MPDPAQSQFTQAALEAAKAVQFVAAQQRVDSLDITDPSRRPADEATPPPVTESPPGASAPTIPNDEQFSGESFRRAAEAGISPEEAKEYGTPKALERAIAAIYRERARYRAPEDPQRARTPAPAYPQEPVDVPPGARDMTYPPGSKGPDGEDLSGQPIFTDQLADLFDRQNAYWSEKVQRLEQQTVQAAQTAQQTAQAQRNSQFDAAFAAAPAEYQPLLGSGSVYGLSEQSPEYQRRNEVVLQADAIIYAAKAAGRQPPSFTVAFQRALQVVLGDQVQPGRARDAAGQFLARPKSSNNGSQSRPPDPAQHQQWVEARTRERMRNVGLLNN